MRENSRVDIALGAGRSPFLTYEPYYGLKEKPFSLSADPRFLYKSRSHGPSFEALRAGIRRREGLIVLTGEPGTGKTTLCKSVLEGLDRKTFCTLVPDPFVSREDLLKMLLLDFGVMSVEDLRSGRLQGASRPELSYPLYEFLKSLVPLQAYAVLIIDEAQNLASSLLEEIRILADLEAPEKLLQLVLVGQPELQTKLKDHAMRQVEQRVSVRVDLAPLDRAGVGEYIAHRLNVAGGGTDRVTFADAAVDAVFRATNGNPRLINLVCDKALHHGHLARTFIIGPELVSAGMVELGRSEPEAAPGAPAAGRKTPAAATPHATPHAASTPQPASMTQPVTMPQAVASSHAGEGFRPAESSRIGEISRAAASAQAASTPELAAASDSEESYDFGLGDKFFERPRPATEQTESYPTAEERTSPPMFMGQHSDEVKPGKRRAILLVLACVLIPALAWLVWAKQNQLMNFGSVSPPASAAPAETVQKTDPIPVEASTATVVPSETPGGQSFEVGVAMFSGYERASRLAVSLAAAGFRATTRPVESEKGRMYEVRTGPYLTRESAEADAEIIRKLPGYADARIVSPTAVP